MESELHLGRYALVFAGAAVLGPTLEWVMGKLSAHVGTAPYVYPGKKWRYTSLEVVPLWGCAGVLGVSLYEALRTKKGVYLVHAVVAAGLAATWVVVNEGLERGRAHGPDRILPAMRSAV